MIEEFCRQIEAAFHQGQKIYLQGNHCLSFLQPDIAEDGNVLSTRDYRGIISYQPSELIITAKSGTTIREINATLQEQGQMLAFEPPDFGQATLGGIVASGLSGPARPYRGALRDYLLGCEIINGKGQRLKFGGEVMKNVAGFDVSRLMAGSWGTLGLITQVTLKVLPLAQSSQSFQMDMAAADYVPFMLQARQKNWPLSASCHWHNRLYFRLTGYQQELEYYQQQLSQDLPQIQQADNHFWYLLNNQQLDFFTEHRQQNLWRISLPEFDTTFLTASQRLAQQRIIEWQGAVHWLYSNAPAAEIQQLASSCGGFARLFRVADGAGSHQPRCTLADTLHPVHQRLRLQFDPKQIFNPHITITG